MDIISQNLGKLYHHGLRIRCQDLRVLQSQFYHFPLESALAFNPILSTIKTNIHCFSNDRIRVRNYIQSPTCTQISSLLTNPTQGITRVQPITKANGEPELYLGIFLQVPPICWQELRRVMAKLLNSSSPWSFICKVDVIIILSSFYFKKQEKIFANHLSQGLT